MDDIKIRVATIADLKDIQSLNQELCVKENREYDDSINPDYPFTKEGEQYFRSRIDSSNSLSLVAEHNGEIIGYLVGAIVKPEAYRMITKMAESENMLIKEPFRGRGVGTKLGKKFDDWCREKGVQKIRHVVSAQNNQSLEFSKARGAKEVNITLEKDLN